MDLTKSFPTSVHEKFHGLVQIKRTIDKGEALAHGNVGEYHYNCGMDQAVFSFLGIDHEALLAEIKKSRADGDAYAASFIAKKTPAEIDAWNQEYVTHSPEGESLAYFLDLRNKIAPDRTDVMTWADLLDLDEKRAVPVRVAA